MPREVTAEELDLSTVIRPGDTVMWTQGAGEPLPLLQAMVDQRERIGPFTAFLAGSYSGVLRPEHTDWITVAGLGAVGTNRALCTAGGMKILPVHFSQLPGLIESGSLRADVVLAQLSDRCPPGDDSPSFGAANGFLAAAMRRARTVVAEFNDRAPWTRSDHLHGPIRVDIGVRTSRPLVEVPQRAATATDLRIAENVAGLIADGTILQLGIGGIPNAVAAALSGHRHLGVHSGVLGDSVRALIDCGAVDNSTKPIDRGTTVAGALAGSQALYEWAHRRHDLRLEPVAYTHAQHVLNRLFGLVAVNSALEVDLTGQVGSEVAGGRYLGTVGGLADFARGAMGAQGGRSVIALPSRSGRRNRASIVPTVSSGVVTLPRADADTVVTEYGVAELRGRSLPERIRRMIAIAHPDDREWLSRRAHLEIVGG
jgi:acyl-CoA hydrolase